MPGKCDAEGCEKFAVYGNIGNKPQRCMSHKEEMMVDVKNPVCQHIDCRKRPSYNFKGFRAAFCNTHKSVGMLNVVSKRCAAPECMRQPMVVKGRKGKNKYCRLHLNTRINNFESILSNKESGTTKSTGDAESFDDKAESSPAEASTQMRVSKELSSKLVRIISPLPQNRPCAINSEGHSRFEFGMPQPVGFYNYLIDTELHLASSGESRQTQESQYFSADIIDEFFENSINSSIPSSGGVKNTDESNVGHHLNLSIHETGSNKINEGFDEQYHEAADFNVESDMFFEKLSEAMSSSNSDDEADGFLDFENFSTIETSCNVSAPVSSERCSAADLIRYPSGGCSFDCNVSSCNYLLQKDEHNISNNAKANETKHDAKTSSTTCEPPSAATTVNQGTNSFPELSLDEDGKVGLKRRNATSYSFLENNKIQRTAVQHEFHRYLNSNVIEYPDHLIRNSVSTDKSQTPLLSDEEESKILFLLDKGIQMNMQMSTMISS